MHRALLAHTDEIDDVEYAIEDLMRQIDMSQLLPNSVGIVYCDPGFYFSGVCKALNERLPFPVLGSTTITAAVSDSRVSQILALMILTSDNLTFSVACSDELKSGDDSVVERCYAKAREGMEGEPALIMTYYPLVSDYDRDRMVDILSETSPGIPIYGTLTSSPALDSFTEARIIYGDGGFNDRMSLLLIYGDIKPRFYLGTFSEEKYLKDKGVITAAEGNRIITINDIPAKDYLIRIGLSEDEAGNLLFPELFPIFLDYNDGTLPYIRAMITNLEDGSVILNGGVRKGAALSVGNIDVSDLQISVDRTLEAMKGEKGFSLAIFHSCAARYFVLFDYDVEIETKAIKGNWEAGNLVPYIFCYSGGEICPVINPDNTLTNRVHAYTISVCIF
ncbi:MAG: FIST C-terminal domain-containing protein [Deltaproteobacteria bacterium]|jgi:hypothetical protein|nr:FIST C-terminal domain-containing protein [Deltaproteobacteria bacterium]